MDFDIGIVYREDMPKQLVSDLSDDLKKLNVDVKVEERENTPFAAIEWAIPAAIIVILTKSYIDGFIKEAGKEHYHIVKKRIADFAKKVLPIKQDTFVSAQSPHKLTEGNPVSNSFSIWTQTLDGVHLRFLFLNNRGDSFNDHCSDRVFDTLLNHAKDYPNDAISLQLEKFGDRPREMYLLFDENSDTWRAVDIQTESFIE